VTIEADSLPELVGALTSAADLLQSGDARQAMVNEVVQLAVLAEPHAADQPPLPQPPAPDYVGTGLTDFQQMQVRQAQAQLQVPVPTSFAPPAPAMATSPAQPDQTPFCPIHQLHMIWKGGALSKNGKAMPLWSCPDTTCKQAIWPARA
jgi:hypothetical protein